ncbi:dual specificity protein phosphatase [Sphaerothrix gracilis]|uniref:protein-tyrosine phosphatase family protein n=1 Tax=Sphaerothrix gracilis TaxID=3151835 RepID=UPI0031FE1BCA
MLFQSRDRPSHKSSAAAVCHRWILPHRLAVGPFPNEPDLLNLQQAKIQAILTLCPLAEGQLPDSAIAHFHCRRYPLPDSHSPRLLTPDQISAAVSQLHQLLQQDLPTYIHCLAGMERSPLICIAYLCRYQQLPVWEALNHVKAANRRTRLTSQQLKTLQQWAKPFG